jgi:signal transduction histidine kinase
MSRSPAGLLAAALLAATVAALAVTAGYGVAAGQLTDAFAFAPVLLAFAAVGAIVASHRPGNPIGWLFLAEGLGFALGLGTDAYATYVSQAGHVTQATAWVDWAGAAFGELGLLFPLVLLVFPDGRLPSPRWRLMAWTLLGVEALMVILAVTSGAALRAQDSAIQASPVRLIPDSVADPVLNTLQTALIPLSVVAAGACVVRYRRSRAAVRQQIKWFAYVGAVTAAGLLVAALVFNNPLGAFLILGPLIPIATGIAVFRYRLYDIDVVISKTLIYGSLAAFISVVYVVIVAGIGALGPGSLHAGSRPSLGLSIVATMVVAVAFQPLRERVQRVANRLVYGQRATPYEALSEFAGQIGGAYAADQVLSQMARILAEGAGAVRADVWLRYGPQLRPGASWPPDALPTGPAALGQDGTPQITGADRVTPVRHQGEVLGALSVAKRPGEPLTPTEDKLIGDLAAQAGLLLRNAGLTEQLSERLAELQASRLRIVTAQDDQRRRIERDIHDGAQQRLLTIADALAQAESLAGRDAGRERALVAQVKAEARDALAGLRELARGIYPPLLADQGLPAAIAAHSSKAAQPVSLDAAGVGRYPADTETAVYFCCVEALQNATRHASQASVRIRLEESAGDVAFSVEDDGPGFDVTCARSGTGLQHMSDRLAALGGSLQVDSRPGAGTTITGRIPVTAPLGPASGPPPAADTSSPGPAVPASPAPAPAGGIPLP